MQLLILNSGNRQNTMNNDRHIRWLPRAFALVVAIATGILIRPVVAQDLELDDQQGGSATIPLASGSIVTISPLSGNLQAQPQPDSPSWQACLGAGGPDTCTVAIGGTFIPNPSAVAQGANIQFSWDARGAWECLGTMENAAGTPVTSTTWDDDLSRLPDGSASVGTETLEPGDYVATLECSNGPTADQASAAFTVTDPFPDAPAFCSTQGRVPPSGMDQDSQMLWSNTVPSQPLTDTTKNWQQFWFSPFPRGETSSFEILSDHYGALAFDTTGVPIGETGQITFEVPQFSGGVLSSGTKLVTLSQCPGDFTTKLNDPECRTFTNNGDLRWEIDSSVEVDFRCQLLPDTFYWLNILYTADPDATPLQWECSGDSSRCGNRADHIE